MRQRLLQNKWYALVCLFACFATGLIYLQNNRISPASLPVAFTITGLVLFLPTKKDWSLFLGIAATGVLFSVITPVLDTPDEYVHLARSFHIAGGDINLDNKPEHLVVSEDYFSIFKDYKNPPLAVDNYEEPSSLKKTKFQKHADFRMTNAYWFIGYIPQATGILLGRALGLGVGLIYYLGRISNAICYAFLAYLAIRLSGKYRQMMVLITMLPMNLFLAASYNQDGFALGMIYLIIGFFIHLLTRESLITNKDLLLYTGLCLTVITLKLPYILLLGLLFFIPKERFATKYRVLKLVAASFVMILCAGFWFISYQQIHSLTPAKGVGVSSQLGFLLSHPIDGLLILLREFLLTPHRLTGLFNFGLLDLPFRYLLVPLFFFYTVVFLANVGKVSLNWITRTGVTLIASAVILGIILILYLTWTPMGLANVRGIQGRYYLGVLPLLTLVASATKSTRLQLERLSDAFVYKGSLIILGMILTFIIASTY